MILCQRQATWDKPPEWRAAVLGTLLATNQDTHGSKVSPAGKKTGAWQKAEATAKEAKLHSWLRRGNWAQLRRADRGAKV